MKRLLAILLAMALLLSGMAFAEADPEPVLEDLTLEAPVEAGAEEESAAEVGDAVIGEVGAAEEASGEVAEENDSATPMYEEMAVKNKQTVYMTQGDMLQLVVDGQKIKKCALKNKKYKKVATVTKKGLVKAVKPGTAKLVITTKKKKKINITVKVVADPQPYTGELMDLVGKTLEDAVSTVGGDSRLIRNGAFTTSYQAGGILLGVLGSGDPKNKFNNLVALVQSTIPTASVMGIAPGEASADARAKALAAGFTVQDEEEAFCTLERSYTEGELLYDEGVSLSFEGGAVTSVAFIAFPDPNQPHEKLDIADLSVFTGKTLSEAARMIGKSDDDIDVDDYQANLFYYDDFMLSSVFSEAGKQAPGVITMVVSYCGDYPVKGVCVGESKASARAKAEQLGMDVTVIGEGGEELWSPRDPESSGEYEESFNVDYENDKVSLVAYTRYSKAGSIVKLADKELSNYIGKDLNEVVKQAGGDEADIQSQDNGDYGTYGSDGAGYTLEAFRVLSPSNPCYDKICRVSAKGSGYTVKGIAAGGTMEETIAKVKAAGYTRESYIEDDGTFASFFFNEEYNDSVFYHNEIQLYAMNGKVTDVVHVYYAADRD